MKTTHCKLSVLALLLCASIAFGQNNLIDSSNWAEGIPTSELDGFGRIGSPSENVIEIAPGPSTNNVAVWRAIPSNSSVYRGLVTTPNFDTSQIDPQQDYRFSVWIKLINGNGGKIIAQIRGATATTFLTETGTAAQAAYFNWGPAPAAEGWYLMVCFINGMNNTATFAAEKGFYNQSGKVSGLSGPAQYRFNTNTPSFDLAYTLNNVGGVSENMMFFNPRLEEVNASIPTISELITIDTDPTENNPPGDALWSTNTNGIHYTDGNVGIGVALPTQKLEVNGQVHAKEVKVDVNFPAPDYVFYDDYKLKTLEEIQAYIKKNGHLPNIPSAAEIEANGIELGLMNMKLLEKIEELTLYILEQDKINNDQELKQELLEQRIKQLEKQN